MVWPVVLLLCTWQAVCIKDGLILQQWGGNRHLKEIQHVIIHVKTPFLLEAMLDMLGFGPAKHVSSQGISLKPIM